jgi:transposase-like protein
VLLVTSDAHRGLVEAIGANLPGTTWQRCRTHYAANVMSVCPKSSWGWVKALLHAVSDQPDADAVHAQYGRILDALTDKLPAVAEHLDHARAGVRQGRAALPDGCARGMLEATCSGVGVIPNRRLQSATRPQPAVG